MERTLDDGAQAGTPGGRAGIEALIAIVQAALALQPYNPPV
jgi:hypothetical protein